MCDVGELQQLANLYVRRDQSGRRYSRVEEGVGGDTTEGERERGREGAFRELDGRAGAYGRTSKHQVSHQEVHQVGFRDVVEAVRSSAHPSSSS